MLAATPVSNVELETFGEHVEARTEMRARGLEARKSFRYNVIGYVTLQKGHRIIIRINKLYLS